MNNEILSNGFCINNTICNIGRYLCVVLFYFIIKRGVSQSTEQNMCIHKKIINSRYCLYVTSTGLAWPNTF